MEENGPIGKQGGEAHSNNHSTSSIILRWYYVLNMKGTWRVVTGLLLFWLLVLMYMSASLYQTSDVNERTERQLARALQELDMLKKQNDELQRLANELKEIKLIAEGGGDSSQMKKLQARLDEANQKLELFSERKDGHESLTKKHLNQFANGPDLDHEQLRRKVENGVTEFWYFMRSQLKKIKAEVAKIGASQEAVDRVDMIVEDGNDHQRTILTDLYNLSLSNGAADWRKQELVDLGNIVQNRLKYLQNPKDCSTAKKLVCNINKGCGYGCQLHHLVYCFIIAYGTERTFILESRGWRYSHEGWEKYFLPLSETCTDRSGKSSRGWGPPDVQRDVQVVDLPIVDSIHPRPPYMPQAIPADLAPRLMRLHGHPFVWWVGQFLKYLLRPQTGFKDDIDTVIKKLGFKTPIVGIHVRRTDKVGTEASFHSIDEYMGHVDEYYTLLEKRQQVDQRRIYLATDDPGLLLEAQKKYASKYEIISDNHFSQTAGLSSRYTDASLRAIILDIHLLSLSDYLVCTFSSQVCRVAYEIMQTYHPDASNWFHSLDDIYYFGGQNAHNQRALYPHQARDPMSEIDLKPGDFIGVAGNHWDGFSKGSNRRTGKGGLYPSYKVTEHLDIVDFPKYEDADKMR